MDTISEKVGSRIRELRLRARLSQADLAHRVGSMGANDLSRYERGRRSPTLATLERLANALNIPVAAFFDFGTDETTADGEGVAMQLAGQSSEFVARVQAIIAALVRFENDRSE